MLHKINSRQQTINLRKLIKINEEKMLKMTFSYYSLNIISLY